MFGALDKPKLATIKDLDVREILTLAPLVALTILFGVYPKPVLDMSAASVQTCSSIISKRDRRHQVCGAAMIAAGQGRRSNDV